MRATAVSLCLALLAAGMLAAGQLHAAELLLSDVRYAANDAFAEIEVRLGVAVEVIGLKALSDVALQVSMTPVASAASRDWSATELSFDERDRILTRVALEGDGRRGYELILEFSEPVTAQLLPQFDDRQVLLKVAPEDAYRKLSRFGKVEPGAPYAISLESRRDSVPDMLDIPRALADTHTVYVTEFDQDGTLWHRLRLGFFPDRAAAERVAGDLRRYFPNAWIEQVSGNEVRFAESFKINPQDQVARFAGAAPAADDAQEVKVRIRPVTPSTIDSESRPVGGVQRWPDRPPVPAAEPTTYAPLIDEARQAFEHRDYDHAIRAYTKLHSVAAAADKQTALEMLGVSRELNRQLAHAKALYEAYLSEYPDTEGAKRVQQRLAALLAIDKPESTARRPAKPTDPEAWRVASHVGQFYQRQSLRVDDDRSVPIEGIFSDATLTASRQGEDLDQSVRITLSHLMDFTNQARLQGREFQVSALHWEGFSDRLQAGVRVGRQSRPQAGILGRFDGAALTYRATPRLAINLTGGYLVDSAFDDPGADRPFFGVSSEWRSESGRVSLTPFFVQQEIDGVLDRRAVGLQSQLQSDRLLLFSLVDYDLHYATLNDFSLLGNYRLGKSQVSASYEHRKTPYLTTRNALIGQDYEDLTELEASILDLQLEDIANDRTATSDTFRLAINTRLSDGWSMTADVVASEFSSTETSADVIGLDSNSTLYSSVQIRAMEPFGRATYSALMIRRSDADAGGTTSLLWDNRLGVGQRWYIYPRLRVDHRTFEPSDDSQWTARPSMRLDFRYRRSVRLEFEIGYTWMAREMALRDIDITGLFLRAGYRASF